MQHALINSPEYRSIFGHLTLRRRLAQPSAEVPEPPHVADRTRRDFIREMLDRNPEAFASDLDVQCMMQAFPGRF